LNLPTGFLGPTSGSVISAGLAGLAGGVFAISHGFTSLQELNWTTSGKVVLITVLGGIGTL
jgi:branched-chain amino acid transport system permease protein